MESNTTVSQKSEILFLYEASYNIPNGDPFTGEQRYDEETKKILVSDVRMKRYVRDYLSAEGKEIYVISDKSMAEGKESGSASRVKSLANKYKNELDEEKKRQGKSYSESLAVMKKCVDVRLFGGISTKEKDNAQLTGPFQFALLNASLNKTNLRMHQNTSVFASSAEKSQGAIGTTTLTPYALIQIHGWLNPKVAETTGMAESDRKLMFEGLWYGTSGNGSSHSRSKIGQDAMLLIEIVYKDHKQKVYGVDRLIKLQPKENKTEEQIRSSDDYTLDFSELIKLGTSEKVDRIRYHTDREDISLALKENSKFEKLEL